MVPHVHGADRTATRVLLATLTGASQFYRPRYKLRQFLLTPNNPKDLWTRLAVLPPNWNHSAGIQPSRAGLHPSNFTAANPDSPELGCYQWLLLNVCTGLPCI